MPKRQPNYVKICMILEKHEELDKDELFRLAREDGVFAPESALSGLLRGGYAIENPNGRIMATGRRPG